ncbi:MAG: glutathione ABC transporter substrate-binding protein GsiB [Betaproteobacteria bacterium]|nr:glutathione ABC transporter substrate-binding protein GsiB [Betaproteobacteria bacterium]
MKISQLWAISSIVLAMGVSGTALAGKDVTMAVASTFTTMDPYDANDTLSQAVDKSFYEGLFGFDKDMKLIPVLALSYEVDSSGLVYTLKLRKGVKFHDGTDFKADSVKASFDRATNPANKLKRYNLYKNIAKTEAIDDDTVRFTLKEPFSAFINQLAHPSGAIISKAALEKYGKDIMFHPVGTGAFKFVEWKPTDYLKVAKFDAYWKKGYPKVDSILWRPVVDNNTRAAMMQTGEAQFTFPVPYEVADVLKKKSDLDVIAAPSIVVRYLSMNMRQKPFDNPKVREAVNYAINRDALVKVAFSGYAIPADGIVPDGVDYSVRFTPWKQDIAKAKKLLAEAGYPNGFETELWSAYNHTTAQKVSQFLQQQLQQVGIKAKVVMLEAGQRVERVESYADAKTAPVRLYYVGWSSSTGEADWAISPLLASDAWPPRLFNTAYYKSDKVDAGLKAALLTTDRAEKARIYREVQEELWKDMPWAPLVVEKLLYAKNKKLQGVYVMPDASFHFDEIDLMP